MTEEQHNEAQAETPPEPCQGGDVERCGCLACTRYRTWQEEKRQDHAQKLVRFFSDRERLQHIHCATGGHVTISIWCRMQTGGPLFGGPRFFYGLSCCSPKDNFCRSEGRVLAQARRVKAVLEYQTARPLKNLRGTFVAGAHLLEHATSESIFDTALEHFLAHGRGVPGFLRRWDRRKKKLQLIAKGIGTTSKALARLAGGYGEMLDVNPVKMDTSQGTPTSEEKLQHVAWMCQEISSRKLAPGKEDRWLGFVQGCMWSWGYLTIDQMREQVRLALEAVTAEMTAGAATEANDAENEKEK